MSGGTKRRRLMGAEQLSVGAPTTSLTVSGWPESPLSTSCSTSAAEGGGVSDSLSFLTAEERHWLSGERPDAPAGELTSVRHVLTLPVTAAVCPRGDRHQRRRRRGSSSSGSGGGGRGPGSEPPGETAAHRPPRTFLLRGHMTSSSHRHSLTERGRSHRAIITFISGITFISRVRTGTG